jgi:hypothetical protein
MEILKKTASEIWLALLVLQATGIFARKKKVQHSIWG